MKLSEVKRTKTGKISKSSLYAWLIIKFVGKETSDKFSNADWGREMAIAKQLFEKTSDLKFWDGIKIKFHINSLCFLISPKGLDLLREKWIMYKTELPEIRCIQIYKDKVAENMHIPRKPITLEEFLTYGKDNSEK